jgi:serine/threonine protein kinase
LYAFKLLRIQPGTIEEMGEKFSDHAAKDVSVEREATILSTLNHHRVPHVPFLEEYSGARTGILFSPVGVPLCEFIRGHPLHSNLAWRLGLALRVLDMLQTVLKAVHDLNIVHLDIRPANIIVLGVSGSEPPEGFDGLKLLSFCLIDWGLAKQTVPTNAFPFGSHGFMDDSLLKLSSKSQASARDNWCPEFQHDRSAALFTFVAIVAGDTGHAPWHCNVPYEILIRDRWNYIKNMMQDSVLEVLDDQAWLLSILKEYYSRSVCRLQPPDTSKPQLVSPVLLIEAINFLHASPGTFPSSVTPTSTTLSAMPPFGVAPP